MPNDHDPAHDAQPGEAAGGETDDQALESVAGGGPELGCFPLPPGDDTWPPPFFPDPIILY